MLCVVDRYDFKIQQMDMVTAFLQGYLKEEVFLSSRNNMNRAIKYVVSIHVSILNTPVDNFSKGGFNSLALYMLQP